MLCLWMLWVGGTAGNELYSRTVPPLWKGLVRTSSIVSQQFCFHSKDGLCCHGNLITPGSALSILLSPHAELTGFCWIRWPSGLHTPFTYADPVFQAGTMHQTQQAIDASRQPLTAVQLQLKLAQRSFGICHLGKFTAGKYFTGAACSPMTPELSISFCLVLYAIPCL